jgi:hypothetical protein
MRNLQKISNRTGDARAGPHNVGPRDHPLENKKRLVHSEMIEAFPDSLNRATSRTLNGVQLFDADIMFREEVGQPCLMNF